MAPSPQRLRRLAENSNDPQHMHHQHCRRQRDHQYEVFNLSQLCPDEGLLPKQTPDSVVDENIQQNVFVLSTRIEKCIF